MRKLILRHAIHIIFVGTRSTCAMSLWLTEFASPSSQAMVTSLQDVPITVPKSVVVAPQQTRSPTMRVLDWSPVNNKDRSNRTTASQPARITYGDRRVLPSRIAPQSGCSRCLRTHDKAVWGKSFQHLQAREKAGALRW
jgi:hypothetical protein